MNKIIKRERRKRKSITNLNKKKVLLISIITVVALILGFGIYTYMQLDRFLDTITTTTEPAIEGEDKPDPKPIKDPFAMVILGLDSRGNVGTLNTDVIMVAVVDPNDKQVTLVSIPRDTSVKIPDVQGFHKVNAVYANGELAKRRAERNKEPITKTGISTVKKTLEGFLGIPIRHSLLIDFEGFKAVIDELGGLEVDVERRLVYHDPTDGTNIDLQPGLQTLNGKQALDYVRHRMDDRGSKYYSSDFDRNERQQKIIRAIVDKMKSFKGVTNIFGVLDAADDHIRVDFSKEQIRNLALTFRSIGSENITSLHGEAYWDSASGYTLFPKENLEEIRETLWKAMGMTSEEGNALLNPDNDIKPPARPKPTPTPTPDPAPTPDPNEESKDESQEKPGNADEGKDGGGEDSGEGNGEDGSAHQGDEGDQGQPSDDGGHHDDPNVGDVPEGGIPGEMPFDDDPADAPTADGNN